MANNDPILTPLFIAAGVTGSFTIGAATITYASILATATILAATVAVGYLTRPGGPEPQDGHQAIKQSIPPRIWAYGRNRIAGAYVFYEVTDEFSYDVMALVSGKVAQFIRIYLHDDQVTFVGGGLPVNTTQYVVVGEDGRYGGSNVRVSLRLGIDTETPYSELVTDLPDIWTANHRGDGIASAMLICDETDSEGFLEIYPHGLPKLSAVMDCYPIWDARDEDQDPDDPSTWLVSDNPVLIIIDYITNADRGGMGLARERLITPALDALMAEADKCDVLIVKQTGGSEKRYRCNTWGTFDMDPAEALADMLASCDGWVGNNGDGSLSVKVGVYEADAGAEGPITEKHILGFSVDFAAGDEELVNELVLGFTSPSHDYTTVPGEPWRDEASITLLGKTRSRPFSPKAVQSHTQLRRLAKRNMLRLNAGIHGQMTTSLYGLAKAGKRWVRLQYPFFAELEDCVIEVRRMQTDFVAGTCVFDWVLVNPTVLEAWDPVTEEGEPPRLPDRLIPSLGDFQPPTNFTASASGSTVTLSWTNPTSPPFTQAKLYRGDDFGTATLLETIPGGLGDVVSTTDVPATLGTYNYWVTSVVSNISGDVESVPAGPESATTV